MARVLVVGDRRSLAEALAFRISQEDDIVETAVTATGPNFKADLQRFGPDVVLADLESSERAGCDVLRQVNNARNGVKAIALIPADADSAATAIRLGAAGVLSKSESTARLMEVVRGVLRGETHVAPSLLTGVLQQLATNGERNEWEMRVARLTRREREVLRLIVAGNDRAAIAELLYLSVNTVRTHVKNILAKLEVHSTLEAVGVALRASVTPPADSAVA